MVLGWGHLYVRGTAHTQQLALTCVQCQQRAHYVLLLYSAEIDTMGSMHTVQNVMQVIAASCGRFVFEGWRAACAHFAP